MFVPYVALSLLLAWTLLAAPGTPDAVPLWSTRPKLLFDRESCFKTTMRENFIKKVIPNAIAATDYAVARLREQKSQRPNDKDRSKWPFALAMYSAVIKHDFTENDIDETLALLEKVANVGHPADDLTTTFYCDSSHFKMRQTDSARGVRSLIYDSKWQCAYGSGPVYIGHTIDNIGSPEGFDFMDGRTTYGHFSGLVALAVHGRSVNADEASITLNSKYIEAVTDRNEVTAGISVTAGLSASLRWRSSGDTRTVQEIIEQGFKPCPLCNTLDVIQPPELGVVHELLHVMGGLDYESDDLVPFRWIFTDVERKCTAGTAKIDDGSEGGQQGDYTFKAAQKRKLSGKSLTTAANYEYLVKGIVLQMERDDDAKWEGKKTKITWPSFWMYGIMDRSTMKPPQSRTEIPGLYLDEVKRFQSVSGRELAYRIDLAFREGNKKVAKIVDNAKRKGFFKLPMKPIPGFPRELFDYKEG